jgi:hypothetical protein
METLADTLRILRDAERAARRTGRHALARDYRERARRAATSAKLYRREARRRAALQGDPQ